jgi:hypothetical protein
MAFLDETGLAELWSLVKAEDAKDAKVATGSYKGTGSYGWNNPNTLTFDFAPKLVWIGFYNSSGSTNIMPISNASNMEFMTSFIFTSALTTDFLSFGGNGYQYFKKSADGKTVSWYGNNNATNHMNNTNFTYYYIAIG